MVADWGRQLEADLHRYYRLDLRDLWRPHGGRSRMTFRLLSVLYDGLPGDSLTKTAQRDAIPDEQLAQIARLPQQGHGRWSHSDLLLARVIDLLGVVASGMRLKEPPDPWPRPGVARPKRRALTPQGHAYLMRLRQQHAQLHGYNVDDDTAS